MPRSYSSIRSIEGPTKGERRSTKNYSTVSSRGGKRRVLTYEGTPTVTHPTSLRKAKRQAGEVRGALRRVRRARKSGARVPEVVPPEFRKTVAREGRRLTPAVKAAGLDESGPEYLGKLIEFESGWDKNAEGPPTPYGTAKSLGQFIPPTAADFEKRFGIDADNPKKPKQAIRAAAMHASGKHGYGALYKGYNPGYSDTDPIPSVDGGRSVRVGKRPRPKDVKILEKAGVGPKKAAPAKPEKKKLWRGKGKAPIDTSGITPEQANVTREVRALGKRIAALSGEEVKVISGVRPGATTSSGNVSDHASGNALDIHATDIAIGGSPAEQKRGDRIAAAALVAAGMKPDEAKKAVAENTVNEVTRNGYRVQVIWKTPDYGGHDDHVHVGIRPEAGVAQSGSGAVSTSGSSPSGGASGAPSPAKAKAVKKPDKRKTLRKLRANRPETSVDADLEALEKRYGAVAV